MYRRSRRSRSYRRGFEIARSHGFTFQLYYFFFPIVTTLVRRPSIHNFYDELRCGGRTRAAELRIAAGAGAASDAILRPRASHPFHHSGSLLSCLSSIPTAFHSPIRFIDSLRPVSSLLRIMRPPPPSTTLFGLLFRRHAARDTRTAWTPLVAVSS